MDLAWTMHNHRRVCERHCESRCKPGQLGSKTRRGVSARADGLRAGAWNVLVSFACGGRAVSLGGGMVTPVRLTAVGPGQEPTLYSKALGEEFLDAYKCVSYGRCGG